MALLLLAGDPAQAAARTRRDDVPLIHTRRQWNAESPKCRAEVLDRHPDHIVVHHTSTPNSTDLSLAHAYQLSRQIQRFHMNVRGWNDIGEQLTISRGGHVMEGRNGSLKAILAHRNVMGAQTHSHNHHTLGIENEGNYMKSPVPERLWDALRDVCVWLCRIYDLDPYKAIVGHRDFNRTECPGDVLYGRLPELRRGVAARLSGHDPSVLAQDPLTPGAADPTGSPVAMPPLSPEPTGAMPPSLGSGR
ncbi:peptidoglycan recognition protein family protein [Actinomadura scrupuli]|uniref:peptidoglycan recognition protein family protein n=1 Tax=Actinomadura scrupuli TaxID=559629 RepID=UPI003D956DA6